MPRDNYNHSENERPPLHRRILSPYYLIPFLLLAAVIYYTIARGNSPEKLHYFYRMTMSTSVEVRFAGVDSRNAETLQEEIFTEMERLESIFSRSLQDSDISHINRQAGLEPAAVSSEVIDVALQAYKYALLSDGAFDPTIAPLIDLWGFLGQSYRVPLAAEIEEALPLVDYRLLEIDSDQSTVSLPRDDMALELGGIAKGYIVDRLLEMLQKAGIRHAYINAGGDIGLIGSKPDGSPWLIGVTHPRKDNRIIAVLPVTGGAVVTSGDYERIFTKDEINYHHILDPENGMPARDLASVTIVAPTVIEADALSTAVFVLGPVKGMALIENLPEVEGILITPDLEILVSSGLEGIVELHP